MNFHTKILQFVDMTASQQTLVKHIERKLNKQADKLANVALNDFELARKLKS